ncbi:dioxygenase [Umezawaea sp. NPDC059074]|uniref:dioxygenase family protein n=1 Tax=Umezawaea sp. NPDC059074 TaxID=3346716 RepID=UPI0036AFE4C6
MADQRTVALFDEFVEFTRSFIVKHGLHYNDYEAVLKYVISVGEAGEWPLLMDVFFESTVNTVSYGEGDWTPSAIEGPYFKEGAPHIDAEPFALPMRPDEPGDRLEFLGGLHDADGTPVEGAVVDVWHSTNDGVYTFFSPRLPDEYLLRGKLTSDPDGAFRFRSVRPVPYEVPHDGPTGNLLNTVLGRHSWRPAHLHFRVQAPGYRTLVTQLYFEGDPYLESDSCTGVKNELVVVPEKVEVDGEPYQRVAFDFVLQPS